MESKYTSDTSGLTPLEISPITGWIFAGLIALFSSYIGAAYCLYLAYTVRNRDYKQYYRSEEKKIYKTDKRYREGVRQIGTKVVKIPVKVKIDIEQKSINKTKSIGYLVIAVICIAGYTYYYINHNPFKS